MRLIYLFLGHTMVALGIVGILVPILPTTPFLLIACVCYERGSPRFHLLLLENKYAGPYLRLWRERRAIPVRAKIAASAMLAGGMGWSIYAVPLHAVKWPLLILGIAVLGYIITRPSE